MYFRYVLDIPAENFCELSNKKAMNISNMRLSNQ